MNKFFELIYGDGKGYACIVTRDQSGDLTDSKWFRYPEELNRMVRYSERRNDEDIYNSVALFTSESRSKLDTRAVSQVVYADADTCHPDNFRMPPTVVVQTSPGRYHCYWVLDESVPAEQAALASQRIYLAHKDQGCDAGWAVSKLLRVPGTTNLKRDTPNPVTAEYYPENVYTLDTFESVYGDVTPVSFTVVSENLPEPVTPEEMYTLETRLEDAKLTALYWNKPQEEQEWSDLLFRLEVDLFREGMDAREVFWLANNAACNKYKRDNRPMEDLWKDVQKAYSEFQAEETVEIPNSDKLEQVNTSFLTLDERRCIKDNPSFIDEYLAWATSRTDAAEVYHRSLAYMLLSQVFGGRGKIVFEFEPMNLNLWVIIAGDTTLTRKSTAKDLMLRILTGYEQLSASPVEINIGQDTTAEGIVSLLGEEKRDGMPALLIIDEVQGWFKKTLVTKYMADVLERLTDMYGGKVPVVVRATAGTGNKRRNETSFSLTGVGIREQISRTLTKDHFASGFLARMLWAVADTPQYNESFGEIPWRKPKPDDENTEESKKASYDPERDRIVKKLVKASMKFPWNKEKSIDFTPAARARINAWSAPLTKEVYFSQNSELLFPTIDRMKYSVIKAAALLSLYDGKDEVEEIYVLHALAQAELWYRDVRRMVTEISSSDYESKLDEVEKYIATGTDAKRLDATVRRQFARYRANEYDDIIQSLRKQGRVRHDPTNRQILEAL